MLNEVGITLGVRPSDLENSMTIDQLRLHWHWKKRADMRRMKMDEIAIAMAVQRAFAAAQ